MSLEPAPSGGEEDFYRDKWHCHICQCWTKEVHIGRNEPSICKACHKFINAKVHAGTWEEFADAAIGSLAVTPFRYDVHTLFTIVNKRRKERARSRRLVERRRRTGERVGLPRKVVAKLLTAGDFMSAELRVRQNSHR